jgi:hypothetical protein
MWPYCGHFQLHVKLWLLDRNKNYAIWPAIANNGEWNYEFTNGVEMQMLEEVIMNIVIT